MGFELYRMILNGHPHNWNGPMVLVASVIADDARDPSQGTPEDGGWPWSKIPIKGHFDSASGRWRDGLTERTGMSERAISRALTDLGREGYEMREQVGSDKKGRPVFAAKGHALQFRVPPLLTRPTPVSPPSTACFEAKARQVRRVSPPSTAAPSPQPPQKIYLLSDTNTSPDFATVEGSPASPKMTKIQALGLRQSAESRAERAAREETPR